MQLIVENDREFISKLIDWFSLMLPPKQQLGPVEKEFFLENALLFNDKIDISSRGAVVKLSNAMGFVRESDVYRYRTKLKNKKWLKQTAYSLSIPGFFHFTDGVPKTKYLGLTIGKDAQRKNRTKEV